MDKITLLAKLDNGSGVGESDESGNRFAIYPTGEDTYTIFVSEMVEGIGRADVERFLTKVAGGDTVAHALGE